MAPDGWTCALVAGGLAALPSVLAWRRLRRLEDLSYRDYQTGLRSGRLFDDDAALVCRSPSPIALLLIDLDNFGLFNLDGYRDGGDAKLLLATRTISTVLHRRADRIYRMHSAGDEFLVLLTPRNQREAHQQAERVRRALELAGVPASIGVAYAAPGHREPHHLLRLATTNKDAAKRHGKNRAFPPLDDPPPPPAPVVTEDWQEPSSIRVGPFGAAVSP